MQSIAVQHLSKETEQNEEEIPNIQQNLREMGLEVDDVITNTSCPVMENNLASEVQSS